MKNAQFQKGHETEKLIEKLLHDSGWMTIPIYNYKYDPENQKEGAPSLIGKDTSIVLPDILAYKENKKIWIECKHEEGASWTWTLERYEHGFARRLYLNYLQVEEITKTPVWIVFHEVNQSGRIIKDRADYIKRTGAEPEGKGWPVSNLNHPFNALKGKRLKLCTIRNTQMRGRPYIYFPQSELLDLGTIESPQFEALENEQVVQSSLFDSSNI